MVKMHLQLGYHSVIVFSIIFSNIHLFHRAQGDIYSGKEGGDVHMKYKFSGSERCGYQLFYNNILFNNNGTRLFPDNYIPGKHQRTHIHALSSYTSLTVSIGIQYLKITDAGRYSCHLLCRNSSQASHYRLHVHYEPAPASCFWPEFSHQHSSSKSLTALECSAKRGIPPGKIVCYSKQHYGKRLYNPVRLPSFPEELRVRFWLKTDFDIRCCAQGYHRLKTYRTCSDFIFSVRQKNTFNNNPNNKASGDNEEGSPLIIGGTSTIKPCLIIVFSSVCCLKILV